MSFASAFPRANPQTGEIEMIDPQTNQPIGAQFNIVPAWQQINLEDYGLGLKPQDEQESPIAPPDPKEVVLEDEEQPPIHYPEGGGRGLANADVQGNRDPSNNFGYFDKPTGMGFLSSLPGPLGMAGKGINAVANANNVGAVNAARGMMGVEGLTNRETLGGVLNDRKGFVGNVDITNQTGQTNQYSVGLEAMTPSGKTTLTPDEARKRSFANPANIELSKQQDESKKGLFSGIKSVAKNIFDNLFGTDDDKVETTKRGGFTVAKEKTGGVYDQFPDRPSAPANTGQHSTGKGRGDLSDRARSDVDRGAGGLY